MDTDRRCQVDDSSRGVVACPGKERLAAYLNERLSAEAATEIEEHLERCPACFDVVFGVGLIEQLRQSDSESWQVEGACGAHGGPLQTTSVPPDASVSNASTAVPPATDADPRVPVPSAGADRTHAPQPPTRLGDYELLEELGRGGMGIVYRARQRNLGRIVALKVIRSAEFATAEEVVRFRREAEAAAHLRHPQIVTVHDVGQWQGQSYFSMEYIEGQTLAELVKQGPLSAAQAAEIVRQIALAVDYAHGQAILHRDLKPSNILIDAQGRPHVSDFGLAKQLSRDESLTETGQLLGTPGYMSPEQITAAAPVTAASDVYSLGALLYCLLAGRPPFRAATAVETLRMVLDGDPVPLRRLNSHVDRDLETLCLKCLEKQPAGRYASAQALADDLDRYLRGEPLEARPLTPLARSWRWCRRRPLVAALLLSVLTLMLAGTGVSTYFAVAAEARAREQAAEKQRADAKAEEALREKQRADAKAAEAVAEKERADEKTQAAQRAEARERAERNRLERLVYLNHIVLADLEWQNNKVGRVLQLLAACPEHLRHWEWRHLQRNCHLDRLTLRGHRDSVRSVAVSPDGRQIASGAGLFEGYLKDLDRHVRVWDTGTGQQHFRLTAHEGGTASVAFSPDGQRLVSGGWDRTVLVFDLAKQEKLFTLRGYTGPVFGVAFGANGTRIASAGDRSVMVWDANSGERLLHITDPTTTVACVAFSSDGTRVAAGEHVGQLVRVWDATTGEQAWELRGHTGWITSVAFSPDGRQIASASRDWTVRVWDLARGQVVQVLRGHGNVVNSLAYSPDGRYIASASDDGSVKVWNADSGECWQTLRGHLGEVLSVTFSPDGQQVVSGGADRTLKCWDLATSETALALRGHTNLVRAVAFSPDSQQLASASQDTRVCVWNAATRERQLLFAGHESPVCDVAFRPDGRQIASSDESGKVKVWAPSTGEEQFTLAAHAAAVTRVAYRPRSPQFATASEDATVKIWNLDTRDEVRTLRGHFRAVADVAFSGDGERLATASDDRTVKLWDAASGELLLTYGGHARRAKCVAFSSDGQRVASSGWDLTIDVWEAATGQTLHKLAGHTGGVNRLAFSADGRRLVSASDDWTVKLWDLDAGQEVLTLREHTDRVMSVAFSRDGRHLASASWDQTVRLRDTAPAVGD